MGSSPSKKETKTQSQNTYPIYVPNYNYQNINDNYYNSTTEQRGVIQRESDIEDSLYVVNKSSTIKNQQNFDQSKKSVDLNQNLTFEAKALNTIALTTQTSTIPAMISLQSEDIFDKDQRIGLDLVCIIDRSGSMYGEKIKMAIDTLYTLLNYLSQNDRLSVIIFNDYSEILFSLKNVTDEKKQYMKAKMQQKRATGGTNVSSSLTCAFKLLQTRKQVNSVTSVFLLSDGQDQSQKEYEKLFESINFPFTLHTFGYGNDHDAETMTKISNLGHGNFYYIKNLSLLDEYFIDALGGLVSVIGQNIQIDVNCQPDAPFNEINISKTHGTHWQQVVEKRFYKIHKPIIASGQRKDFLFELTIPPINQNNNETIVVVVVAKLNIQSSTSDNLIQKECSLILTLTNDPKKLKNQKDDIEVKIQQYRIKVSDIIEIAQQFCQSGKYEEARTMLKTMIDEIENDKRISEQSKQLIQDLKQSLEGAQQQKYDLYGQFQMRQMAQKNQMQVGINSYFDQNGLQYNTAGYYQNQCSLQLYQQLLDAKNKKH